MFLITAETFRNQLHDILARAAEHGELSEKVNSGDLHRMVGGYPGTDHRMPVCCQVMYDEMKADDKILKKPPKGKGKSNNSIQFTTMRRFLTARKPSQSEAAPSVGRAIPILVVVIVIILLVTGAAVASAYNQQTRPPIENDILESTNNQ